MIRVFLIPIALAACGGASTPKAAGPAGPAQRPPPPADYRRVELPGFSIDVPIGLGTGEGSIDDYAVGEMQLFGNADGMSLQWSVGPNQDAADMPATFKMTAPPDAQYEIIGTRAIEVNRLRASQLDAIVGEAKAKIRIVDVACGKRHMFLTFVNTDSEVILRSFDCHPTEAEAAIGGELPTVAVDDVTVFAGWEVVATDEKLSIKKGNVTLMFLPSSTMVDMPAADGAEMFWKMAGAEWRNDRVEKHRVAGTDRELQMGTMSMNGLDSPGVASAWRCGSVRVFALAVAIGEPITPAIEVLKKARCARPGDPKLPRGLSR